MPDDYDQSRRTLAGTIESHNDMTKETRRKIANTYALEEGVIEEGEDLINDYHRAGIHDLRSVQSFVDGDKKDWEEAKDAIDNVSGGNGLSKRQFLGLLAGTGAAAAGGSFLAGIWPFAGGGEGDSGPFYVGRAGFEEAYDELNDADQMSIFSDAVYEEMLDGEGRDLVGAYFDHNPSDNQTDSSFKYFFAEEIDDYMTESEDGEMEVDYSRLEEEDPEIRSTSWQNTDDSIAETFEKYGTRNKQQVPDLLEGGLE